MKVIGYLRVSTDEQARSGLGLDAQREAIQSEADRRGWEVEWVADDGYSAKDLKRPGIRRALDLLEDGGPDVLVVAKLDRLSRSLFDFASLMERARREGWALVALDLGVDTTTPSGEMMASVMAAFAQYERRLIGQRTRDALAAKKRQGARLGRPVETPDKVVRRVVREREEGRTLVTIADGLNRSGIPTPRNGKRWYPASVARVLRSVELDREAEEARSVSVNERFRNKEESR